MSPADAIQPDTRATAAEPSLPPAPIAAAPLETAPAPEPSLDAQALWLELERRDWTSLALVPAEPGATMPVALALSAVCAAQRSKLPLILPGEQATLAASAGILSQIRLARAAHNKGERLIIALGDLAQHPAGAAIARGADCAAICIRLHKTSLAAARAVIDLIGAERCAGYIVLEDKSAGTP